jgi:hypothetical protein
MSTPTAPGITIGETQTAGDYTWTWNGYGWDLATAAGGGFWYGSVQYSWVNVAIPASAVYIDYV